MLASPRQSEHAACIVGGCYLRPTVCRGHNKMRIFQEEIFGPALSVTTFKGEAEALEIANDTIYGLGSGVWSRNTNTCYRMGRGIYKQSGIGRENHKMMLDHYQQTKNMLVGYSTQALGFF